MKVIDGSLKSIDESDIINGVLTLPDEVKSVHMHFFENNNLKDKIKTLILPDNYNGLFHDAFIDLEYLEHITLPKNLKLLTYGALSNFKRLKSVELPEGLEEINSYAFAGCENLESITIPSTVFAISEGAFKYCKKLKTIKWNEKVKVIPTACFQGCEKLEFDIPKSITEIHDHAFHGCRSLKSVTLNENVEFLGNSAFENCFNLEEIKSEGNKKVRIGEKCFRNCKSLKEVPTFIDNHNKYAFENCLSLEKIEFQPLTFNIPEGCFRGCKNLKKLNNTYNICKIESYAFSGCDSLETIYLNNISTIAANTFSNCKNLEEVRLTDGITRIENRAFYNCPKLEEIDLPETVEYIGKEAFKYCNSIKEIWIPANLKDFGIGAFANMDSLERIDVSPFNKTYMTPDNKILIHSMFQRVVLYPAGIKDKSYSMKDYNIFVDDLDRELIRPIDSIGEEAFAGNKNLEELTLCACTMNIEADAFLGCNNLKKLNVLSISLYSNPGFNIRDHGRYYYENVSKKKLYIPFETVEFQGDPVRICHNALENFHNVKNIILPTTNIFNIGEKAFKDCKNVKEVFIPNNVNSIGKYAFNENTKVIFENGLSPNELIEMVHSDRHIGYHKLYHFYDYYIIEQNNKFAKITKEHIRNVCTNSDLIENEPALFLYFIKELYNHDLLIKPLLDGILMSKISEDNLYLLFKSLKKDDKFFIDVINNSKLLDELDENTDNLLKHHSFSTFIDYVEVLRKYGITDDSLQHKIFMVNYDVDNFEYLIKNELELLKKTINYSGLLDANEHTSIHEILNNNSLLDFIKYIKKYDIKDKYVFNIAIIAASKNKYIENLFKYYDANTKRLLKMSEVLDNYMSKQNLEDLLTLMRITGAFESDDITRQKAQTFITEKMFLETFDNGEDNNYRIVGDDIHRIFNFPMVRDEFDQEFANFFLENYPELLTEERNKSGFIYRVYINFRQISKTCTSNKGSQRKLKVTIDKCKNFLSNVKFDGVTKENQELANFIGVWYDKNETWTKALRVYEEAKYSPRNIFAKVKYDEVKNPIYDNDPENDLREEICDDFSFEWLPKQDKDNLILGKYANCCAHIDGAGQGIMRASMILNSSQNLVIRNDKGEIIAKSTIYVNKEEGYAVFNNVETNLNYRSEDNLEKVYNAFLRGARRFLETYNKNNPKKPIEFINIGANRNTILKFLTDEKHPSTEIKESLKYGDYSLGTFNYNGDWEYKQRLVLKKGDLK